MKNGCTDFRRIICDVVSRDPPNYTNEIYFQTLCVASKYFKRHITVNTGKGNEASIWLSCIKSGQTGTVDKCTPKAI